MGNPGWWIHPLPVGAAADARYPWLVKTDGAGVQVWSQILTNVHMSGGRSVAVVSDWVTAWNGYEPENPPPLTFKTDAAGCAWDERLWVRVGITTAADGG